METNANAIKRDIQAAWDEVSLTWKDEYAKSFKAALIDKLGDALDDVQKVMDNLNEEIESARQRMRDIEYSSRR
ncbi:MAG: hypothetical protein LBO66_00840 [Deltaproteobacteria bacterium]|jgi:uncharacterized protein YukE|nr:hypothetical protein [Deltaproteobacteria bacterium]